MRAGDWEFRNRAMIFGMIMGCTFPLYAVDHQNSAAALANWFGSESNMDPDTIARLIFSVAAALLALAALLRTWASAYLHAKVVYAAEVKTAALVADGPYRRVRNPLYFANVLMAVAMGTLMSRSGAIIAIFAMWLFCYRLIRREEAELRVSQGERYEAYLRAVPRFWPSFRARIASAGTPARWADGFKAELWYWGFAASLASFAATLKLKWFFIILTASILLFWITTTILNKKDNKKAVGSE